MNYFNHSHKIAESRWDRTSFVSSCWHIFGSDPYWVPPYYPAFRRALEPSRNPHLDRLEPLIIHSTAVRRSQKRGEGGFNHSVDLSLMGTLTGEVAVAAAVAYCHLPDSPNTAYLGWLHGANDPQSLELFLYKVAEEVQKKGCRRLVGPAGLSPHLGSGLLLDHWDQIPPLHTAYNPPYMPDMLARVMEPVSRSRLYYLDASTEPLLRDPANARLAPLEPSRLATDLLPLFATACQDWTEAPSPDAKEAAFILAWIRHWPLKGWLALVKGQPVGFVLLQPDLAPRLKQAQGGHSIFWRLWLSWMKSKPARRGRLLYGGVLPEWRGRGIGSQLLHQALEATARLQGWESLSIGPLAEDSDAARWLENRGARPHQHYQFFQYEW